MRYLEYLVLIFFTYSFAGWFMESVGGIAKEKKFINRGFLIGPYCPVYGIGVVGISVFLQKYQADIPVVFVLSTVICGTLEYFTSYIMEKLFNARWWDYHNKKFNINGRICLETLLPFGIGGTLILCYINPILYSCFDNISAITLNIIVIFLCVLFAIDFIVSFCIISSFKGEIYTKKDNTEEISNKVKEKTEEIGELVKDKAEDKIMEVSSDAIAISRRIKTVQLKTQRKVKYTRNKIKKLAYLPIKEVSNQLNYRKDIIKNIINDNKNKLDVELKIKQQEIIDRFKNKSVLSKRLMDAFPRISIKNIMQDEDKLKK